MFSEKKQILIKLIASLVHSEYEKLLIIVLNIIIVLQFTIGLILTVIKNDKKYIYI